VGTESSKCTTLDSPDYVLYSLGSRPGGGLPRELLEGPLGHPALPSKLFWWVWPVTALLFLVYKVLEVVESLLKAQIIREDMHHIPSLQGELPLLPSLWLPESPFSEDMAFWTWIWASFVGGRDWTADWLSCLELSRNTSGCLCSEWNDDNTYHSMCKAYSSIFYLTHEVQVWYFQTTIIHLQARLWVPMEHKNNLSHQRNKNT